MSTEDYTEMEFGELFPKIIERAQFIIDNADSDHTHEAGEFVEMISALEEYLMGDQETEMALNLISDLDPDVVDYITKVEIFEFLK